MDPSYTMVSRQALQYLLLPKKANECYSLIVAALENVEWVSITLDIWTSRRMHSYLGVIDHFISTGWDLQIYLLSCTRILGRHTASNITSELQEVLIKYRIEDKIFTAVTDNASNMKKAFNYRETISLYDEDVHECDDIQGIDLMEEPPSEEEDNDNNANDNQSIDFDSPIEDELYINRISCFAHTLQLTVSDGLKQAKQMNSLFKKVGKIVGHAKKSTTATEELEKQSGLTLVSKNETCWNSQLKMVRQILELDTNAIIDH